MPLREVKNLPAAGRRRLLKARVSVNIVGGGVQAKRQGGKLVAPLQSRCLACRWRKSGPCRSRSAPKSAIPELAVLGYNAGHFP